VAAWKAISGRDIAVHNFTVGKDFEQLLRLFQSWRPDAVVHFAEQRAAPYSMKSARHKRYTVDNNLNATNDVLARSWRAGWTSTWPTSAPWGCTATAPRG
jgi:UDP-sulfoquinovose synthase